MEEEIARDLLSAMEGEKRLEDEFVTKAEEKVTLQLPADLSQQDVEMLNLSKSSVKPTSVQVQDLSIAHALLDASDALLDEEIRNIKPTVGFATVPPPQEILTPNILVDVYYTATGWKTQQKYSIYPSSKFSLQWIFGLDRSLSILQSVGAELREVRSKLKKNDEVCKHFDYFLGISDL